MGLSALASFIVLLAAVRLNSWAVNAAPDVDSCPGYNAHNVKTNPFGTTLTADLTLAGKACNIYGTDVAKLKLEVVYETSTRIHVKITDPTNKRYEVPESVFPRPKASLGPGPSEIQFTYTTSPFTFTISRAITKEVLFTTGPKFPIIYEDQYLRVKTSLPPNANIYGLGEHTNPFRLPTTGNGTTLTLWSRDAYGVPAGTNLYGNHPVYFEHRKTGTHGVFLLNSNGMDIKVTEGSLEYNAIGGILDFYFLAGSTTSPIEVAKQYADVAGKPALMPYWGFGLHQCRFGYNNYVDVADVISNYSAAGIPLETMWTDIDYMDKRRIFTVDPHYFPLDRMREIVDHLHQNDQKFILMTDPAVAHTPNEDYGPYSRGKAAGVWLKTANGSDSLGLVWPGVTVYPDWFHPQIQNYWSGEFQRFYSPQTGLDIDGAWIDMNEPASFCNLPCTDPDKQATEQQLPPPRTLPPPPPDVHIFGPDDAKNRPFTVNAVNPNGFNPEDSPVNQLKKRDFGDPRYAINNAAGSLSSKTAFVDSVHANNLTEYDTHNIYGTMMSTATRTAMLSRRPSVRPLIITRSTFAGAGRDVGKWLGDNFSDWDHYKNSIAGMLGFASIYQVPMVGADICGFAGNTTEELCARWGTLGAFYPFMRNHNSDTSISQEFYRWEATTRAAKNALNIRYRLIDYLYTALHQQHVSGTPLLSPMFYLYPKDTNTFPIDLQFFFGPSILVSPVTDQGSTSVNAYIPSDTFYTWKTLTKQTKTGSTITFNDVAVDDILLHIKGGSVLPLRIFDTNTPMTTKDLRTKSFEYVIAPNSQQAATGTLFLDDGESLNSAWSINVQLNYRNGRLLVTSTAMGGNGWGQGGEVNVERVKVLGVAKQPRQINLDGKKVTPNKWSWDKNTQILIVQVGRNVGKSFEVDYA
ncbi:alpha-glucosidase [Pluteus cervinus]|uniref:Alpha-glucosidase n=1 Tax=Pluteus cervinus TaxID=181527 RepID=A0ACD3AJW5_9AGAR|nr:alpha-glucosidase [Pluteus cervinus]